jgi:hypothetical protein
MDKFRKEPCARSHGARVAGRYAQTTGKLAGCDKLYRH